MATKEQKIKNLNRIIEALLDHKEYVKWYKECGPNVDHTGYLYYCGIPTSYDNASIHGKTFADALKRDWMVRKNLIQRHAQRNRLLNAAKEGLAELTKDDTPIIQEPVYTVDMGDLIVNQQIKNIEHAIFALKDVCSFEFWHHQCDANNMLYGNPETIIQYLAYYKVGGLLYKDGIKQGHHVAATADGQTIIHWTTLHDIFSERGTNILRKYGHGIHKDRFKRDQMRIDIMSELEQMLKELKDKDHRVKFIPDGNRSIHELKEPIKMPKPYCDIDQIILDAQKEMDDKINGEVKPYTRAEHLIRKTELNRQLNLWRLSINRQLKDEGKAKAFIQCLGEINFKVWETLHREYSDVEWTVKANYDYDKKLGTIEITLE